MRKRAHFVVGLGFGDEGKGSIVDALVRRHGSDLVVRFNGGAQAGHNVVTSDGRHHTFSQWGSGTFVPGCQTYLSKFMVVHPTAMLVEAEKLENAGVSRPLKLLHIDRRALVNTPFHQADNRLEEMWRAHMQKDQRHGSVGVGFGSTVRHSIARTEAAIRFEDLADRANLVRKLYDLRDHMRSLSMPLRDDFGIIHYDEDSLATSCNFTFEQSREIVRNLSILDDPAYVERIADIYRRVWNEVNVVDSGGLLIESAKEPVFEGAQGVLLDERFGFHPHTTWSCTTDKNAYSVLYEADPEATFEINLIGVTRAYMTRHGRGPMPTEEPYLRDSLEEITETGSREHNTTNLWQEGFRYGWLDLVLLDYAVKCLENKPDQLAVNHLDQALKLGSFARVAHGYDLISKLTPLHTENLLAMEKLGVFLSSISPRYSTETRSPLGDSNIIHPLVERLGIPLCIEGRGPTAADKRFSD